MNIVQRFIKWWNTPVEEPLHYFDQNGTIRVNRKKLYETEGYKQQSAALATISARMLERQKIENEERDEIRKLRRLERQAKIKDLEDKL